MPEGLGSMAELTDAELKERAAAAPEDYRVFLNSILEMRPQDRQMHLAAEHTWSARCGELAYLWFHDLQCYGWQTLRLPADRRYRVELIDTWAMTRETICEKASGETVIQLPGREGLAVLATAIEE